MKIVKYFLSTLIQIIIFKLLIIFIVLLFDKSEIGRKIFTSARFELIIYFILSITLAILTFFLVNRMQFVFQGKNIKTKYYATRFFSRILAIIFFLTVEAVMEKLGTVYMILGKIPDAFGDTFPYLICNLNLAFIVSLFPLTYGIIEVLFVNTKDLIKEGK